MFYTETNNWEVFSTEEIIQIEKEINALHEKGIDEVSIVNAFERIGLPLLYNCPGFYNKFCADTDYNIEIIKNYIYNQN